MTGAAGEREAFARPSRRPPMPHPAPAHKSFADRNSLYQEITDKIIAELEQGRVPWVQPWASVSARRSACRTMPPPAALQRHQYPDPVDRLHRARLHRPELAHFPPGAGTRRPCAQGRERHHGRLCRPLRSLPRTHARGGNRRRTRGHPVPQALHGLQYRSMRGSSGRPRAAAGAAVERQSDPAAGRGADPRDRRRSAHRRRSRLLCPERTTTSRCRRLRRISSRSTCTARSCHELGHWTGHHRG